MELDEYYFRYEFVRISTLESGLGKDDEALIMANSISKKLKLFLTQRGIEQSLSNIQEYHYLTKGKLLKIFLINWNNRKAFKLLKEKFKRFHL